ncbi:IS5/IS1182 family transposase (plasmid) [Ralstonia solanacearum]|uniref:IS5 family transposase n=1 Tax=Ralstonia pseudosolanacearum TaxID=1310165 RepID=UPI000C9EE4FC|nr:IS5 family transposase [Ralstonia pseudosolanacearum]AUS41036.1 IS5/IS1182 family transposase [Ralstonia solanacearum]AUS41065.1 IS5/IS1182 family transposase [Ralstonia solanacearum]AUS41121.1 IS5/IS1182 family transposase [Ralstonia solanacearum]AUS41406.1 IS5/IS1182 family transposase [Ralstonia solanacearum]AUS41593.1 IS5/IS1182 family transposase [Ralstonia solanacearum]
MKRQISFAEGESHGKKRVTRRQRFLTEMESVVPWSRLIAAVEPYYPKGKRGRPPIGLERMLRIYFLQQWYGLSDEALEDALYDSMAMRAFAGIDLAVEAVPDATTLLKFRRLLVEHELTRKLFDEIGIMLCERGLMMKEGTIVDATIIEAPPSTKNKEKSRDPEMHQTKKGNAWHFGMKAHLGVDAASGLVHSVVGTAANESDVSQAHALLHGHEEHAFGDAGYTGVDKRDEMQGKSVKWQVAVKRGKIKAMRDGVVKDLLIAVERAKAQIRARVEHPFHVIKNLFGHRKVRYKGLTKNTAQLFSLFGLANLVLTRKLLLASGGSNPS